jgi:hypothetical protein
MDEVAGFALCIFATRFSFWLCRFSLSQLIATKKMGSADLPFASLQLKTDFFILTLQIFS